MPKTKPNKDAEAFGRRLVQLLEGRGRPRRGAGSYLAARYKVADVTANAWLNGHHRAETELARRIAVDHGATFDWLYAGIGTLGVASQDVDAPLRQDLADARIANDIDALRYAVSALAAVMVRHRPTEAVDAAKAIKKAVPAKFLEVGFVHELLGVLELAQR